MNRSLLIHKLNGAWKIHKNVLSPFWFKTSWNSLILQSSKNHFWTFGQFGLKRYFTKFKRCILLWQLQNTLIHFDFIHEKGIVLFLLNTSVKSHVWLTYLAAAAATVWIPGKAKDPGGLAPNPGLLGIPIGLLSSGGIGVGVFEAPGWKLEDTPVFCFWGWLALWLWSSVNVALLAACSVKRTKQNKSINQFHFHDYFFFGRYFFVSKRMYWLFF